MKRARLAVGWLKQKTKLLPVLLLAIFATTLVMSAVTPRAYAASSATWSDNYKTLTYDGIKYTGGTGSKAVFYSPKPTSAAGGCRSRINFSSDYKTATAAVLQTQGVGASKAGSFCLPSYGKDKKISVDVTSGTSSANTSSSSTTGGEGDPSKEIDPCNASGVNLSWVICPVIDLLNTGTKLMQATIDHLMIIDVKGVFGQDTDSGKAYYQAWNSFRLFGIAFLVIAGLVMVITQALGLEVFDAYTVRKVIPRLITAAIGISLSWWLLEFLVSFTDALGIGIRSIIYYPFKGLAEQGYGGIQNLGSSVLEAAVGGGAIVFMGIGGVLSLLATAALAALIAFVVLVLRQIVIVFLILMAPIAIACYVLPNTQKIYSLWWESLFKGLMMFPIISAFIAAGQVFSLVASSDPSNSFTINKLVGIIAYFLPYFALPFTFRLAGGALATIGGLANDRSRGAFDRLKKFRCDKVAMNTQRMRSGNRFEGTKYIPGSRGAAAAFNRTTAGIGTGTKGRFGIGERGAEALDQTHRTAAQELMKGPQFNAIKDDDNALRALTYDNYDQAYKGLLDHGVGAQEATRAVNSARASVGFGRAQAVASAQQMINTGTAYKDVEDLSQTLARASGGNSSTAAGLAGFANAATKQAGRHDLAPGFGGPDGLSQLVQDEVASQRTGTARPDAKRYANAHEQAWNSASLYQQANDKPANIKAAVKHHTELLRSGDAESVEKAAIFFNELKSMQPNASGDVKNVIDHVLSESGTNTTLAGEGLDAVGVDLAPQGLIDRTLASTPTQLTQRAPNGAVSSRLESARQRIERRSRTYERVDPNHM